MKKKSILVSILSILVVIGTFSFCIYENNKSKLVDVTANVTEDFSALSNKKICWGIKRSDNHEQPDVGKENKRIIDKYNGMCLGKEVEEMYRELEELINIIVEDLEQEERELFLHHLELNMNKSKEELLRDAEEWRELSQF